jgi:hypothetical protein
LKIPFLHRGETEKNNSFLKAFSSKLPEGMYVPKEFSQFFKWAEKNGCIGVSVDGEPFVVVDPIVLGANYVSSIYIQLPTHDEYWLSSDCMDSKSRLRVFARTGADGSSAALWLDDNGQQHIVHMGSGSGSVMVGKWVNTPVEFLQLLAIGYDELCWPEDYDKTPQELLDLGDELYPPLRLREWVEKEFNVLIPQTARVLVNQMSELGEKSDDPFCVWVGSLNSL